MSTHGGMRGRPRRPVVMALFGYGTAQKRTRTWALPCGGGMRPARHSRVDSAASDHKQRLNR